MDYHDILYVVMSVADADLLSAGLRLASRGHRRCFDDRVRTLTCRRRGGNGSFLSRFPNLTQLDLSNGRFQPAELRRILEAVGSLKRLDLSNSRLDKATDFPSSALAEMRGLERLDLNDANLRPRHLPPTLSVCLRRLSLNGNPKLLGSTNELGALLGGLTGLRRLEANHVNRRYFNHWADVKHFASSLKDMRHLRHLDIGRNNLHLDGALALAASLANAPDLRYLNAGRNDFGWTASHVLVELLGKLPQLRYLDLSHNNVDVCVIASSFRGLPRLLHLRLEGNRTHPEVASDVLARLPRSAQCVSLSCDREASGDLLSEAAGMTASQHLLDFEFLKVPFTCSEEDARKYL